MISKSRLMVEPEGLWTASLNVKYYKKYYKKAINAFRAVMV